jgi:signal transduction histidine kinase
MLKFMKRASNEMKESPAFSIIVDLTWSLIYGFLTLSSILAGSVGLSIFTGLIFVVNFIYLVLSVKEYKKKYSTK